MLLNESVFHEENDTDSIKELDVHEKRAEF